MTYRTKKTTLFGIVSVIAASGVFVFATGSRFGLSSRWVTSRFLNQVQDQTPKQIGTPPARNLSLQPLAFKVGRGLGQRFAAAKREKSLMAATILLGSERRDVQVIRTQTDNGEQV